MKKEICEAKKEIQRDSSIDLCRGIGILLVLLGHTNPPFMKYIYSFHMPLFFILSGYLYKRDNLHLTTMAYIRKIARAYLSPYIILCVLNLMIQMIFHVIKGNDELLLIFGKYVVGIMWSKGSVEWMPNCSPLWYLTALFSALLIFTLIMRIRNAKLRICLFSFCPLLSFALDLLNILKLPWNIDSALMGVLFINLGWELKNSGILERALSYKKVISLIILFIAGSISAYLNSIDYVNFDNNEYGNVLLMIISAFSLSITLLSFCKIVCGKVKEGKGIKIIMYLSRHTLFIMGFDYLSTSIAGIMLTVMRLSYNWFSLFTGKLLIISVGLFFWRLIVTRMPEGKIKSAVDF